MLYETTDKCDGFAHELLDLLVQYGYLQECTDKPQPIPTNVNNSSKEAVIKIPTVHFPETGSERFVSSHETLETIIEKISKENLGKVDDRKDWKKPLNEAVKEYGRDEVIKAFYEWSQSQGGALIYKPVTLFLRNVGQNVALLVNAKPQFTNPAITRVEERVAYISDNKVFFAGSYRIQLAALIKEHGEETIVDAFGEFFQNVESKELPWAAKLFLERASVIIGAMKQRATMKLEAELALQQAYSKAKQNAPQEIEEEEDDSL